MSTATLRWIAVGVVMTIATLALTQSPATAYDSTDDPDADLAAREYADYFGVDQATAKRDIALTDEAARLQNQLAAQFPQEFAGLWIERNPDFRVVVAMTANRDEAVRSLAGPVLDSFLMQETAKFSLIELEAALDHLEGLDRPAFPSATEIDVRANQVILRVLVEDQASAEDAIALTQLAAVRLAVVSRLPEKVANIYGGVSLNTTCGGLQGTGAFNVKKNGSSLTGIMTAGHLSNCLKYSTTNLTFKAEKDTGDTDAQWHETPGLSDPPRFWATPTELRYVEALRTYASIVNGQLVCKNGRSTGYGCGTVESKTADPDGPFGPHTAVFVRVQACSSPDIAAPGDSGGPVFWGTTAIGHVTHDDGDIFCSNKMLFNSLTHSTASLGVSILIQP